MLSKPSRTRAIAEGIAANVIWSSSFVIVKMGIEQLGPLTIAGLRYFLAALVLFPWLMMSKRQLKTLSPVFWLRLLLIGLTAYTIGNGAYFIGLQYLSATTLTFLASLGPIVAFIISRMQQEDIPSSLQLLGLAISVIGSLLFFLSGLSGGEVIGVGIVLIGLIAYTYSTVLGREVAKDQQIDTLMLTTLPLAFGGALLLCIALPVEGLPVLSLQGWSIVILLTFVNTVVAYLLYNHALQEVTAFEMNTLFNLSPLATAILAWYILGESLSQVQVVGMVLVIIGVTLVQLREVPQRLKVKPSLECNCESCRVCC